MGSSLSSFNPEGDKPNMFIVHLLFVFSTVLSLAASHGFFRGYRNSRTWGSGDQRQARTLRKARMGRQQGDNDLNSISVPSISPECSVVPRSISCWSMQGAMSWDGGFGTVSGFQF